jgi:hypothetical protein
MKLSSGQLRALIKQVVRESRGDPWEDKEREDLALQALSAGARTAHEVAEFMFDNGIQTSQTIAREVLGSLSRKGKAARGMLGWRRTNFSVDEAVCPKCGNKDAYIGMNDVECPERSCDSFSKKQYVDVFGEESPEPLPKYTPPTLDEDAFYAAIGYVPDPENVPNIPVDLITKHVPLPPPEYGYFCIAYGDLCAYKNAGGGTGGGGMRWDWRKSRWVQL